MEDRLRILSDKEIKRYNEDLIGFQPTARAIRKIVTKVDTPFTIGIVGSWGVGKTSLMQMTRDLLKDKRQTVWFDAWAYDKTENIGLALINQILVKTARVPGLWNRLKAGAMKLSGKMDWTHPANWLLSLLPLPGQPLKVKEKAKSVPAFMDEFEKIVNNYLEIIGKERLIIFIDDLDRCTPPKPLEVLEAIKLFLWIDKCVFVLGVQREIIEKSIVMKYSATEEKTTLSSAEYLDKIFQLEYTLRELRQSDAGEFIDKLKEKRMISEGIASYSEVICRVGGNLRRIKRLLNSFEMFRVLKGENEELNIALKDEVLAKLLVLRYHPRWKRLHKHIMDPTYVDKNKRSRILQTLRYELQEPHEVGFEEGGDTIGWSVGQREVEALNEFTEDSELMNFIGEEPPLWDVDIGSYLYLVGEGTEPMREDILRSLQSGDILEILSAVERIRKEDEKTRRGFVEEILKMTFDADINVREGAAYALARLKESIPEGQLDTVVKRLLELTRDSDPRVKKYAAMALEDLKESIPEG